MSAMIGIARAEAKPIYLTIVAGLACAFAIAKAAPLAMDRIPTIAAPLCAVADSGGSALNTVEPIASYALPNVPGKRVTIVRVFYGPGGIPARIGMQAPSPPISPKAKSDGLGGDPVEIFKARSVFLRPPGATHLVSANASNTEPAELVAVFVADEGAQLTTLIE